MPGPHRRHADARPQPRELLRRDRAGRVPPRPPRARHRLRRRPAAARPAVLLPRHAADPPRRPELLADPDQPAARRVNDNNRDGFMQQAVHEGVDRVHAELARRRLPVRARRATAPTPTRRARSTGPKIKLRPASFDDHFTQATLFYRSLTDVERDHIVGAFSFELGKCVSPGIHARMVGEPRAGRRRPRRRGRRAPRHRRARGSPGRARRSSRPRCRSTAASRDPSTGRSSPSSSATPRRSRVVTAWRAAADPLGVEIVVVGPAPRQARPAASRSTGRSTSPTRSSTTASCSPPSPTPGDRASSCRRRTGTTRRSRCSTRLGGIARDRPRTGWRHRQR